MSIPEPKTIQQIIETVAWRRKLEPIQIMGRQRSRDILEARWEAMARCALETTATLVAIGRAFDGRGHSAVLSAIRQWRKLHP